ncbi:MAG: hypothetical protein JXR70_11730 [Spirochaetales bacterium]|nr:hypothetical protein [Spirochaetales bacterium]
MANYDKAKEAPFFSAIPFDLLESPVINNRNLAVIPFQSMVKPDPILFFGKDKRKPFNDLFLFRNRRGMNMISSKNISLYES